MTAVAAMVRGYDGTSAASRKESRAFACSCGLRFTVVVWRAVDARADPEAAASLLAGRHNRATCPSCGIEREVQVSVVYHDPRIERLILVLPDGLRHRELEERALLYRRLADDGVAAPSYVREFLVAFGPSELQALLSDGDRTPTSVPSPAPTVIEDERTSPVTVRGRRPTPPRSVPPPVPEPSAPFVADPDATQLKTVIHRALPDLRTSAIERWTANREGPSALLCGEQVVLCAALPAAELEAFVAGELELRLQLHRLPTYPVLAISIVAAGPEPRGLHALIEIGRAAHRAVIDRLTRECSVTLELFDAGYSPRAARELAAPLEENLKLLFNSAKQALQGIAPTTRSFERARAAFVAPGYDRIGSAASLSPEGLGRLDSPAAARRALATVAEWSEPAAEAYLVEIRSLPIGAWRSLRTDVVRRAIDLGIHTPRELTERVLAEAGVQASWSEVLRRQVAAFSQILRRRRPSDLSPEAEAENGRLLLDECAAAQVAVDPEVRELVFPRRSEGTAAGAAPEHGDQTAPAPKVGDLHALETAELVALLERRDLRREAALAICERRDEAGLAPVFLALRKMTRAEASRVLPATVIGFGRRAEGCLIQGLQSRKSYLRQGCALGLGTLGSGRATEPLVRLLLDEPTEVWREVARALGDLGEPAAIALGGKLRDARGDGPERIVRALGHLAVGERQAVERLATMTLEPVVREAARRALGLVDEVRRNDAEVRGGQAPRDQTVVRGFSRRFFEALGGDLELSDADLEELPDADEPELAEGDAAAAGDEPQPAPAPAPSTSHTATTVPLPKSEHTNPDATNPRMSLPPEPDV